MTRGRRLGKGRRACVGAGLLVLVFGATSAAAAARPVTRNDPRTAADAAGTSAAPADSSPGSGFLSYGLIATAPGLQVTQDDPSANSHPQAEGEVPEAVAQLSSGPSGYALSSIAWPGSLVANAGALSQLINLGLPNSVANALNDPVRAEARTGNGPSTVTNNSVPGTVMTATATDSAVSADAVVAGASGPAPQTSSGNTESNAAVKLSGPATAVATASSIVQNVNLAGGVVTIRSVTSTATATSDGVTATAKGQTIVTDLEIAGQPAYIDQTGLHVGRSGPGQPVNATAAAIANAALGGFGMKFAVSQPSLMRQGAQVTYDAGTVVFYWVPTGDSNHDTFTATLGGASVTATATPALGRPGVNTPIPLIGPVTAPGSPALSSSVAGPVESGVTGAPSAAVAAPSVPGATGQLGSVRPAVLALPKGLSPLLPILVLFGSGLIAAGLIRLPDRVLEQSSATCEQGGHP